MQVRIINGQYRGTEIVNTVFPLVKPLAPSTKGFEITVDARGIIAGRDRIRVVVQDPAAIEYLSAVSSANDSTEGDLVPAVVAAEVVTDETPEEAMTRIRKQFQILETMTDAIARGNVRGLIVSGPPGVGKSWGVESVLSMYEMTATLSSSPPVTETITGGVSPIGLYKTLYENSSHGNIVVFDDCDSVLFDELCLNMLKGAIDSGKRRRISWKSESRILRQEGIPDSFDFNGGIIFITNVNFDNVRSKKIKDHLAALMSRCHYIDLGMYTASDKFLRINQIVADGMLSKYKFTSEQEGEIIQFLTEKASLLRELSLRTVVKLADLRLMDEDNWRDIAESTLMRNPRAERA